MKVLVTFAVEREFSPWRRLGDFRPVGFGAGEMYGARIGTAELRVLLTGVGRDAARQAVEAALGDRPDFCISSGLAGGLRPMYAVGDILVARAVRSNVGHGILPSEDHLVECAARCGAHPVHMFWSSETLVRTVGEKYALGLEADAVEMESYAVLAEAARRGVPAVAIRAVSDTAAEDLPYDFDRARDARGQIRLFGVLAQVGRRPQRVLALVRFARHCRKAAVSLARFLGPYVESLATEMRPYELDSPVAAT